MDGYGLLILLYNRTAEYLGIVYSRYWKSPKRLAKLNPYELDSPSTGTSHTKLNTFLQPKKQSNPFSESERNRCHQNINLVAFKSFEGAPVLPMISVPVAGYRSYCLHIRITYDIVRVQSAGEEWVKWTPPINSCLSTCIKLVVSRSFISSNSACRAFGILAIIIPITSCHLNILTWKSRKYRCRHSLFI